MGPARCERPFKRIRRRAEKNREYRCRIRAVRQRREAPLEHRVTRQRARGLFLRPCPTGAGMTLPPPQKKVKARLSTVSIRDGPPHGRLPRSSGAPPKSLWSYAVVRIAAPKGAPEPPGEFPRYGTATVSGDSCFSRNRPGIEMLHRKVTPIPRVPGRRRAVKDADRMHGFGTSSARLQPLLHRRISAVTVSGHSCCGKCPMPSQHTPLVVGTDVTSRTLSRSRKNAPVQLAV